jgi:uncharacterized radical SAM superfamily protein
MKDLYKSSKSSLKKKKRNKQTIDIFVPGKTFPSISLTGEKCELNCAHCGGHYIKQMSDVQTPEELIKLCQDLSKQNAVGALISGGCDQIGHVIQNNYLSAMQEIKRKSKLKLNIHTGLITIKQAKELVGTGVDVVSIDIVGDSDTIREVYGLTHSPEVYLESLLALQAAGFEKIVPHVCVGLNFGKITGEYRAIEMISKIDPINVVFIVLIPTAFTRMQYCEPPAIAEVIDLIKFAREKCGQSKILLGCMRPRSAKYREYNQRLESAAIKAGIDGLVLPSKTTLQNLEKMRIEINVHNYCCAVI